MCPPFLILAIYLLFCPLVEVQMLSFVMVGSLLAGHGVEFNVALAITLAFIVPESPFFHPLDAIELTHL